ncbi:MAG TPA: MBL fold metallo-hydrolase [Candidatus Krumholzibacteria bacterium]|nr:MBL fold metallo-hydrolase [Candidatus Krumholzibacteria bacterium]
MNFRVPHAARTGALAAGALTAAAGALAQPNADEVTIKSTRVAGNVYMLEGRGGNMGVCIGPDGVLLIDDQFAPLAEKIRAALRDLDPGPLEFILNTHYHGDHVGGNPVFGKEGTIIAHENVRKRVSARQEGGERVREALDPAGWPVVTFKESVTLHFNGEDIRFVHLPAGHTDGDGIVHFPKANVVHMGDLMFSGRFPYIDTDGGGTVDGYADNLAWVLDNLPPDAKVIPGHGPLCTMEDVKGLRDMIVETRELVRAQVKAGKSIDQIKQAGLPEKYKALESTSITGERWIEALYQSARAGN